MTEHIHVRVKKAKKEEVKKFAELENLTITAFVISAINDRINKSKGGQ